MFFAQITNVYFNIFQITFFSSVLQNTLATISDKAILFYRYQNLREAILFYIDNNQAGAAHGELSEEMAHISCATYD
jgi:hypothetical protein